MEEKSILVTWMMEMQEHAYLINIFELKNKVVEMTQDCLTPFKDDILG